MEQSSSRKANRSVSRPNFLAYYEMGTLLLHLQEPTIFDIHMSVHRNIIPNYSQQDTFLDLFIFTDAVHVAGGFSAHRQEHINVHTASGIVNQYCC